MVNLDEGILDLRWVTCLKQLGQGFDVSLAEDATLDRTIRRVVHKPVWFQVEDHAAIGGNQARLWNDLLEEFRGERVLTTLPDKRLSELFVERGIQFNKGTAANVGDVDPA